MNDLICLTLFFLVFADSVSCCSVEQGTDTSPWSMEKILHHQDIVVYGQEVSRFTPPDATHRNAIFSVFCVMKNDNTELPIPHNLTVEWVEPHSSCSGTWITLNTPIILGLTRTSSGNFARHEPHDMDSASIVVGDPSEGVLSRAMGVCGLEEAVLPSGRLRSEEPQCPRSVDVATKDVSLCTTGNAAHNAMLPTSLIIVVALCYF